MVRNGAAIGLVLLGLVIVAMQFNLRRVDEVLHPPLPSPAARSTPQTGAAVPVIWREFRPGERQTGPAATIRVCAAALDRRPAKSALIIRFCDALPMTPQQRFAFGFDDLVIRAKLPGGAVVAWDLLDYDPLGDGRAARFSQGRLPENTAPISKVFVDNVTDLIFIFSVELPLGLPAIDVSGRYAEKNFAESLTFAPLGPDLEQSEAARVAAAPDWTRPRY
jgi:hypothetical protein